MKKGPHKMMLESSRYDKWDRDRGGGGGGAGAANGPAGAWAGRDRERDRERERQMRAHQMSLAHAPEPDASSLFPAPVRVTGTQDSVTRQIQTKLGDYHLAQSFIDDPSKSIGICAEPPSPAPCLPSRRESEFKKPAHAPQNGVRVHHQRPPIPHNKNDGTSSSGPMHRPPPLRIPNPSQSVIDSSQPPIESILKEMKSLPTPLSVIAATPRKELENKFIFNPYTNKVQENPQLVSNDLKTPLPKPGLDNRISNSRSSVSPSCDVANKDLGLSESDDEVAATHAIGPPISPLGSGSPSSGSSSPSEDSESESSSAESTTATAPAPAAPAPAPAPAQRPSWSLVNFAPRPTVPSETYNSGKEIRHALADIKGKPSPISEMSDSEASTPSPGVVQRRRSIPNRVSAASSDEDTPRHSSAAAQQSAPLKRGRPPKQREDERPVKKPRGRPRKTRPPSPPAPHPPPAAPEPPAAPDSDVEPDPPHHHSLQDTKTHIFRKVFTPKAKNDEGGGKGGKGGKGKGGKGKGQVTIIERTPESGADEEARRQRSRSIERRNEEALARLSPPQEVERRPERAERRRDLERHDRPSNERISNDRVSERTPSDRFPVERLSERNSHERIPSSDRIPSDRITSERIPSERMTTERTSNDRIPDRLAVDRISTDRTSTDRTASERSSSASDRLSGDRLSGGLSSDRLTARHSTERLPIDKMERLSGEKSVHERLPHERIATDKISHDRLPDVKPRLSDNKMLIDRLVENKGIERLSDSKAMSEKVGAEKLERTYVRAEADVGSGLKSGRGSERLEEASSNVSERRRARMLVRVSLARLRPETLRALQRPRRALPKRTATPHTEQSGEVAATNHERTDTYSGQMPIYFSYFERLPSDALSDEERNHKYYLDEATRLRNCAERSQEPLPRVMLYLESVLCFVLTGRVLELECDTKGAFTIYRETIEYIRSIHSMPQRFRASPHDTFNKLDILSLRVQALLYLRMFKMYNREVKEYRKIVNEYQQKVRLDPALAESVSPLSPTPSPAGSVGSVGSGSASSGYCSLAHSAPVHAVPAHAHQALLMLNKYYAFLYVAHDLWEQADALCRLRAHRDLFIAVDRKCGPLSLSSTFRHLVQYVRHAISLLKTAPRE